MKRRHKNSSRDKNKIKRKRSNNSRIKVYNPNLSKEALRRKKKRALANKKKYRRRRIGILVVFILIVIFSVKLISRALGGDHNYTYPPFREEVRNDINNNVMVSLTEGRSLTSSEKLDDFEYLTDTIKKTFPADQKNIENFKNFEEGYKEFKDKISKSKTDEEFYKLIEEYVALLNDSDYSLMHKAEYNSILNYFKNQKDDKNPWKESIENPTVLDRYNRIVEDQDHLDSNLSLDLSEDKKTLTIKLNDFVLEDIQRDSENLKETIDSNTEIKNVFLDLTSINSTDNEYWIEVFIPNLLKNDINEQNRILYRSDFNNRYFDYINENTDYANFSKEMPANNLKKIDGVNLIDYMYYRDLTFTFKNNKRNFNVFIILDSKTKSAPETFAALMQKSSNAYIIGQSPYGSALSITNPYLNLKHSGLIVKINTTNAINYFGKIDSIESLHTDLIINSEDILEEAQNKLKNGTLLNEIEYFKENDKALKEIDKDKEKEKTQNPNQSKNQKEEKNEKEDKNQDKDKDETN